MTMKNKTEAAQLILASSSPRRRELLTSLGIPFIILKPDIDENQREGEAPLDYVRRLSIEKAMDVLSKAPSNGLVLAADTIVIHENTVLGKPVDADDARHMLGLLRNRKHQVCTAITLMSATSEPDLPVSLTRLTTTDVTMRDYTDSEINTYIATGDPFDKAGSYAIQHLEFNPVAHIEGSYSNVVGLPLETLAETLAEIGWG
jgi:septum formation protein